MIRMRTAFFGGTFDPIHRGHLAIASAAADAYALDQVLFAPVGRQPLKAEATVASFQDRLAMTRLAVISDPRFAVSAVLTRDHPEDTLFALAGADSFLTLRHWRSPEKLLSLAQWIVVSRPEFPLAESKLIPLSLNPAQRSRIHLLNTVHEDVSASELRRRLRAGDPCAGLLPAPVADYIQTHHLYR
jgi:nicotinate-nucleotide adenylyltransferase